MLARSILAAAVLPSPTFAATYYVSNAGNDSAAGQSHSAPLRTIARANQLARSGDTILLQRGGVFRESVAFSAASLTIDAYGGGARPIVSGSRLVDNFAPAPGRPGIHVADVPDDIGYVFASKQSQTIARYPNAGWLRTTTWTENTSSGTNTVITSNSVREHPRNRDDYWNGANIRWRRHSWWFETRTVSDYSAGGQLSLGQRSLIPIQPWDKNGWGFYLDNKLDELDAPGEYYFDRANRKLYYMASPGADPNALTVEASVRGGGLSVNASTVRNIAFEHQKSYGLQITGQTTVEDSRFEGIGDENGGAGLSATWNTRNARVRGNSFANNFNASIDWIENPDHGGSSVIERNTIVNSGMKDGYGGSGSWKAAGIVIPVGRNIHVQHNRIDGTGYAGIIFGQPGNFAEYNVIDRAMSTLNDGAAIYTNTSQSTIRHNIIRDTRGGMESSGPWANLANGIWTEFLGQYRNQVIENNTVINSGSWGIYFDNNFDSIIRGNVIFGSDRSQLELSGTDGSAPQNNQITGNVFVGTGADEMTLRFKRYLNYGAVDSNWYINHTTDRIIAPFDVGWAPLAPITLEQWEQSFPAVGDDHARDLGWILGGYALRGAPEIYLNETDAALTIPLQGLYLDVHRNLVQGSIQLQPYTSVVLIPVPEPAAAATAGAAAMLLRRRAR